MMRKNNIGDQALNLLKENKLTDAVELFNQECDILHQCEYSNNKSKCVSLCLIPKLNFLAIRGNDIEVNLIIEKLKNN